MKVHNTYKFRMYPKPEQEEVLFKTIGAARKMYNLLLEEYNANYSLYKSENITKEEYTQNKNSIKPIMFTRQEEYDYLSEVDSTALKYAYSMSIGLFRTFLLATLKGLYSSHATTQNGHTPHVEHRKNRRIFDC